MIEPKMREPEVFYGCSASNQWMQRERFRVLESQVGLMFTLCFRPNAMGLLLKVRIKSRVRE
ncbi:hypothetical protein HanIR_Chr12g0613111 [Helianthus annuus]|nr:hypothetical protein HanIR_Chr12g0613111 [Helianthus annuus]